MSKENVDLAYRAFDMVNRRDLDGFLALMTEDAKADSRLALMEGGYHGHDGIRRWWKNLFEGIPDFTVEVVEVRDLGNDLMLAVLRNRGHGAVSATPLEENEVDARMLAARESVPGGVSSCPRATPSKPPECGVGEASDTVVANRLAGIPLPSHDKELIPSA